MRSTFFTRTFLGLGLLGVFSFSLVADEPLAKEPQPLQNPPPAKENTPAPKPKAPQPILKVTPPVKRIISVYRLTKIVQEAAARTIPVSAKAAHLQPLPAGARLDLEYIPESWYVKKNTIIIAARLSIAQTMTMKSSGTIVRVAMPLRATDKPRSPDQPLVVDIRRVKDGKPVEANSGDDVLTKANLDQSLISKELEWVAVDLPPVHVDKGEQLALVLSSESVHEYAWGGDINFEIFQEPPGTYEGGRAFNRGKSAARAPADDTIRERWGDLYLFNNIRAPAGGGEKADFGFQLWLTPDEAK